MRTCGRLRLGRAALLTGRLGRSAVCLAAFGPLAVLPGPLAAAEFRATVDNATIVYDAPSSKSKRIFVLSRGYPLEVMVSLEGWTKIRDAAGSIGWVEAKAIGSKRTVVVKPGVAEVRTGPEESASVAFKAARGVVLEWVETLPSGWTRVRHADAGTGFVRTAEIWGT